jgi:hypothetical protein
MKPFKIIRLNIKWVKPWLLLPLLMSMFCSNDNPVTGTITETNTGIAVCMPDGTPAIDAIVKFIPASRTQSIVLSKTASGNSASAVVKTNNKGRFEVPALADSVYNIFMEKDNLKAFQGSVAISPLGNAIHDDTLRQTGSFTAIVGLDPKDMHKVGAVIVQILGSDVQFLNPDDSGMFTFKNIAAGSYKLRLELNESGYSQTFFTMNIQSGIDSLYPDTIKMKYTGIPSVKGLTADFDTSKGVIILKWLKSKYTNLLDYVIYRDDASSVGYSTEIYKSTTDTIYSDTIFNVTDTASTSSAKSYRYRIAIRDNSINIGNSFGAVTVTATPHYEVLPVIDSIYVHFDTSSGIAKLTWKSAPEIDSTFEYTLIRSISGYTKTLFGNELYDTLIKLCDTLGNVQLESFSDTLFPKTLSFSDSLTFRISYKLSVYRRDWKLSGKPKESTPFFIKPYKNIVPLISSPKMAFDTLNGTLELSWKNSSRDTAVNRYRIIRTVVNSSTSLNSTDTTDITDTTVFSDSIFPNFVPFNTSSVTKIYYSIVTYNSDWKVYGDKVVLPEIQITPYKPLIPNITNLSINYDTLKGIATVHWDSVSIPEVTTYRIIRNISNAIRSITISDTIPSLKGTSFTDTIYPKTIPIEEISGTQIRYNIASYHSKWEMYGENISSSRIVYSYKAFKPVISAGNDQTVDISTDVLLEGKVISTTYPVVKMEWKIGENSWVDAGDSGKVHFISNSDHYRELITCVFRVSDSMGNAAEDTTIITKTPLLVTLSKFSSRLQGTQTCKSFIEKTNSSDDFLFYGEIDYGKFGIWSTSDLNSFALLNANTSIKNYGQLLKYNNIYYIYNISKWAKSYKSNDGVSWVEIAPSFTQGTVVAQGPIITLDDKMITIIKDDWGGVCKMNECIDGITWDTLSQNIPFGNIIAFFKLGSSMGLITTNGKYTSDDKGLSWQQNTMWDIDGDVFPDDVYQAAFTDSVTIISYQERPAYIKRIAMFRKGKWQVLPIDKIGISFNNYGSNLYFGVVRNLCLITEYNYNSNSEINRIFKLY